MDTCTSAVSVIHATGSDPEPVPVTPSPPSAPPSTQRHISPHPARAPPSTLSVRIHSLALTSRVFAVCVRTLIVGAIVGQRRHTLQYFPHRQDCTADDCGARWSRVFRGQGAFARPPFQRSWRCLFYPRTLRGPRRGRAQGGDANYRPRWSAHGSKSRRHSTYSAKGVTDLAEPLIKTLASLCRLRLGHVHTW